MRFYTEGEGGRLRVVPWIYRSALVSQSSLEFFEAKGFGSLPQVLVNGAQISMDTVSQPTDSETDQAILNLFFLLRTLRCLLLERYSSRPTRFSRQSSRYQTIK